jgi:hypothetical protein
LFLSGLSPPAIRDNPIAALGKKSEANIIGSLSAREGTKWTPCGLFYARQRGYKVVAPYYFKHGWNREKLANFQEEIFKAKERLIEEFNVHEDTYMKIRKIHPHVPAFLGNIFNGLKSMLFY